MSVAVLPDGRVLYWNGLEGTEHIEVHVAVDGGTWAGNSRARILDLGSGTPRWSVPGPEDGGAGDMFCADQKILPDGRVVIAGGTEWTTEPAVAGTGLTELYGRRDTRVFNPKTDRFAVAGRMRNRRWYPSLVTLRDGRILALSGVVQLAKSAGTQQVRQPEVFDPATRKWTGAGPEAAKSLPLYPRVHLLPDGQIFYSGAGQMWGPFGESYDQVLWNLQARYEPRRERWQLLGPATYGARNGAFSVLLPLRPPYTRARVLVGGGTLGTSPGSYVATDLTELITLDTQGTARAGDDVVSRAPGPRLSHRRWFSSGVLLPDGTVGVFSGADTDGVVDPGSERAVKTAELYDPATNTWRDLSAGRRERGYHNSAALLPDGSVLIGGHSPLPSHYVRHGELGAPGAASNFKDPSFEIYRPPYLFRGSRPAIVAVPDAIGWGRGFRVRTPDAFRIVSAVLIRLPAATHTVDADQRAVFLRITRREGSTLMLGVPDNRAVLPPGPYYLFLNARSELGPVPSVAQVVRVGGP
ncbi:MAG TPA: galactose oxidase-like domain-containing protein [Actinomycetota bacterium]|nr:galactose oxidase-like domain-containing protein [Actinomycetota bacterium]